MRARALFLDQKCLPCLAVFPSSPVPGPGGGVQRAAGQALTARPLRAVHPCLQPMRLPALATSAPLRTHGLQPNYPLGVASRRRGGRGSVWVHGVQGQGRAHQGARQGAGLRVQQRAACAAEPSVLAPLDGQRAAAALPVTRRPTASRPGLHSAPAARPGPMRIARPLQARQNDQNMERSPSTRGRAGGLSPVGRVFWYSTTDGPRRQTMPVGRPRQGPRPSRGRRGWRPPRNSGPKIGRRGARLGISYALARASGKASGAVRLGGCGREGGAGAACPKRRKPYRSIPNPTPARSLCPVGRVAYPVMTSRRGHLFGGKRPPALRPAPARLGPPRSPPQGQGQSLGVAA